MGGAAGAWPGVAASEVRRAVSANAESQTRYFTIGIDPRLKAAGITEEFLLEQFKLSSQVRDRVTDANSAVIRIRVIREQVEERLKKIPSDAAPKCSGWSTR